MLKYNMAEAVTIVEDVYEKVLGRLNQDQQRNAKILLHLVVCARRPLTLSEMDVEFQLATDPLAPEVVKILSLMEPVFGLFAFVND